MATAAMRETLREQLTRDDAFAVVEAASAHEARLAWPPGSAVRRRDHGRGAAGWRRPRGVRPVAGNGHVDAGDSHEWRGPALRSDDTITIAKPFRLSELMAHCARTARRAGGRCRNPWSPFGSGRMSSVRPTRHCAMTTDNLRIRLTEKEAAILAFLHRMGERAVPRQELLTKVWGYNPAVTTHTLETHIYRLRRKIEADPAKACLLITEAGGYRLAVG